MVNGMPIEAVNIGAVKIKAFWVISQSNIHGLCSNIGHFKGGNRLSGLVDGRLASPSPVRARLGTSPGSARATPSGTHAHSK